MDKLREFLSSKIPDWILISLLVIALLLIYSSVYTNDYLMNDELSEIGTNKDLFDRVRNLYFVSGRGLVGIPNVLIYRLIGFQHLWVLAFRFIHLCLYIAFAVILFRFLVRQKTGTWFAFFSVLFLMSQTAMQGMIGYSIQFLYSSHPALWLSLAA